jgi:hypothetical protein
VRRREFIALLVGQLRSQRSSLQTSQVLPFALSLIMQRLSAPWQIIRLAIKMAASDDADEIRKCKHRPA